MLTIFKVQSCTKRSHVCSVTRCGLTYSRHQSYTTYRSVQKPYTSMCTWDRDIIPCRKVIKYGVQLDGQTIPCIFFFFIYFADRASQYIHLNINQLDTLNFIMSLFHASTCFEHTCSSPGGQNCTIQSLVSSHL